MAGKQPSWVYELVVPPNIPITGGQNVRSFRSDVNQVGHEFSMSSITEIIAKLTKMRRQSIMRLGRKVCTWDASVYVATTRRSYARVGRPREHSI